MSKNASQVNERATMMTGATKDLAASLSAHQSRTTDAPDHSEDCSHWQVQSRMPLYNRTSSIGHRRISIDDTTFRGTPSGGKDCVDSLITTRPKSPLASAHVGIDIESAVRLTEASPRRCSCRPRRAVYHYLPALASYTNGLPSLEEPCGWTMPPLGFNLGVSHLSTVFPANSLFYWFPNRILAPSSQRLRRDEVETEER
ncbi:hypothetical protein GGR57DRAFT_268514 [Xylariaceae sp. FL1272]|nr:hypothetical protein GGR57DRAFT_268514 [Xylariaceae sp. FL1272]